MNSKKNASKRQTKRDQNWHAQNGGVVSSCLMALARPGAVLKSANCHTASIRKLLKFFRQSSPRLTTQDAMGLVVLRLMVEFWPVGKPHDLDPHLAALKALAVASSLAHSEMHVAGFAVPRILHPQARAGVLRAFAKQVLIDWLRWYDAILNPRVPPASDRHQVARELARQHCYPPYVGEEPALKKTRRLLDAYFQRIGHGGANLDVDDVSSEFYILDPHELTAVIRKHDDGVFRMDPRAARDALRKARHALQRPSGDSSSTPDGTAADPRYQAEVGDQLAALLDKCDEVDGTILANWGSADVEVAKLVRLTPQAVGKRRRKILNRAAGLGTDATE